MLAGALKHIMSEVYSFYFFFLCDRACTCTHRRRSERERKRTLPHTQGLGTCDLPSVVQPIASWALSRRYEPWFPCGIQLLRRSVLPLHHSTFLQCIFTSRVFFLLLCLYCFNFTRGCMCSPGNDGDTLMGDGHATIPVPPFFPFEILGMHTHASSMFFKLAVLDSNCTCGHAWRIQLP